MHVRMRVHVQSECQRIQKNSFYSQSIYEPKISLIKSIKSEKKNQAIWLIDLVLLSPLGVI